jgi:asparagine synthase (glutamine-hydrolysing)
MGMTPLELVSGMVRGIDPTTTPLPAAPPGLTTKAALEEVVRRALQRPPCVVSFSDGRDSSAILARSSSCEATTSGSGRQHASPHPCAANR